MGTGIFFNNKEELGVAYPYQILYLKKIGDIFNI